MRETDKDKKELRKLNKTFKKWDKKRKKKFSYEKVPLVREEYSKYERYSPSKKEKQFKIPIKAIAVIIILLLIGFYLYYNPQILDSIFESFNNAPEMITPTHEIAKQTPCTSKWFCTGWSNCSLRGNQERKCTDAYNCESVASKPNETQTCTLSTIELEKEVHDLTNKERLKYNLRELEWDGRLANIARNHSADMALNDFFNHLNLKGEDPSERGNAVSYPCLKDYGFYYTTGIAENIFQGYLYSSITKYEYTEVYDWSSQNQIAQDTVNGWMDSPGHRENILTSSYDKEGIGVAISSDYKVYVTQNFC
ncbi:MAG: CAP domain-containing protein [Candidatus Aenigmatarchaeota archaeon]